MLDRRLSQMLTIPQRAYEQPTNDHWVDAEQKFRSFLDDFKAFLTDYGTGSIDGFIWIFNPASSNQHLNLGCQINKQLASLREASIPRLRLYPDDEGILPFGMTDNGDLLAWKVHGKPNTWPVVVVDSRAPVFEEFDLGFSQFLAGILSKDLTCTLFPSDYPSFSPR